MSQEQIIKLIKHQSLMVRMPWEYPHIQDHFMIGGYSSGKTLGLVISINELVSRYWKHPIEIGLFSPTLTFMKKTLITQMEKLYIQSGTKYSFNKQDNIIKIGNLKMVLIPIDQPKNIYGHNLCAAFVDELDELSQDVAMEAYGAISERVRIEFPDGKKPFSLYATTAQGYRGTYQTIEELKDKGIGYTHIRGLTKDNVGIGIPHETYDKWYSLFDENERMAFLEGRFVNLTAGRVYPGYDEAKCMVEPFDIGDRETVYVGQDLNEGYSKATAWVVRNRILYAIKEWSFKDIGLAAKEIRIAFPTQEIRWYPDAAGKPIMAGYTHEYSEHNIMPQFATVNPSRLERVFIINKLFYLGRAKVFKTLKELPMALKTRQYDERGDPEKGKGPKAPDHVTDSADYATHRVISFHPEFTDLWELTSTFRRDRK
jgi:hypothetical protein